MISTSASPIATLADVLHEPQAQEQTDGTSPGRGDEAGAVPALIPKA